MKLGSMLTLSPVINFARRDTVGADVFWGPRTIPDCQFFYVIDGEAELLINQERYRISPGQCVFFGANCPHQLTALTVITFYSIHFQWTHTSPEPVHPAYQIKNCTIQELSSKADVYELEVPLFGMITIPHWFEAPEMEQVLWRIAREYQWEKPGYPFMLRALLMELISILVRHLTDRSSSKLGKIEPALALMRDNPEQEWTVEYLASLCGYHPTHFTKIFKEETGRTPKQYMISEKIKRAKQLLLGGETLDVIVDKLNYNNVHYFSHQFKKETGLTPSVFRQQGNRETLL